MDLSLCTGEALYLVAACSGPAAIDRNMALRDICRPFLCRADKKPFARKGDACGACGGIGFSRTSGCHPSAIESPFPVQCATYARCSSEVPPSYRGERH